jgi:uncharacterized membrane protein (UPF0127 family)
MNVVALSMAKRAAGLMLLAALAGCSPESMREEDLHTVKIRMPNGSEIRAEKAMTQAELTRGMKYRDSLAKDRGMLFLHMREGNYPYWMHEVKIPLDLIWMDKDRRVVQIVYDAPPCPGPPESCKMYGGGFRAMYVLELAAGQAKAMGIRPGVALDF